MGLPLTIDGYEPEWIVLAQELQTNNRITWPIKNVELAKTMRFRFYGFRKALKKHDAENPWVSALMETQATVNAAGDLTFARNPYSDLMKSFMQGATFQGGATPLNPAQSPAAEKPSTAEPLTTSTQDETLMKVLFKKPLDTQ